MAEYFFGVDEQGKEVLLDSGGNVFDFESVDQGSKPFDPYDPSTFGIKTSPTNVVSNPEQGGIFNYLGNLGVKTAGRITKGIGQLGLLGEDIYRVAQEKAINAFAPEGSESLASTLGQLSGAFYEPNVTNQLTRSGSDIVQKATKDFPLSPTGEAVTDVGSAIIPAVGAATAATLAATGLAPASPLLALGAGAAGSAAPGTLDWWQSLKDRGVARDEALKRAAGQYVADTALNAIPLVGTLGQRVVRGGLTGALSEGARMAQEQAAGLPVEDPLSRLGTPALIGAGVGAIAGRAIRPAIQDARTARNAAQLEGLDAAYARVLDDAAANGVPQEVIDAAVQTQVLQLPAQKPVLGLPRSPVNLGPEGPGQFQVQPRPIVRQVESPILDTTGSPIVSTVLENPTNIVDDALLNQKAQFFGGDINQPPPQVEALSSIIQPDVSLGGPRNTYSQATLDQVNKGQKIRMANPMSDPERGAVFLGRPANKQEATNAAFDSLTPEQMAQQSFKDLPESSQYFEGRVGGRELPLKGSKVVAGYRDVLPFYSTIAKNMPAFRPTWDAAVNTGRNMRLALHDFTDTLRPYFDLDTQETNRVNLALDAFKRSGKGNQLFTPQVLQQLRLSPKEQAGIQAFKRFTDKAVDEIEQIAVRKASTIQNPEQQALALNTIQQQMEAYRNQFYVPRRRYGDNIVVVKDPNGQILHAEFFDASLKDMQKGKLPKDVLKVVAKYRQSGIPKEGIEISPIRERGDYAGDEIPLEVLGDLINQNQVFFDLFLNNPNQEGLAGAAKGLLGANKKMGFRIKENIDPRGFQEALARAKNIEGYSKDFKRGISKYAMDLARYKASSLAKREFAEARKAISPEETNLYNKSVELEGITLSNSNDWPKLKQFVSGWYLAGSPKFWAQQALQPIQTTLPELVGDVGLRKGAATWLKGYDLMTQYYANPKAFEKSNPSLFKAIKLGERAGTLDATDLKDVQGRIGTIGGESKKSLTDALFAVGDFLEQSNRTHAFISKWILSEGADAAKQKAAEDFARYTQFVGGKIDTPKALQGPMSIFGTMRFFPYRQLRLIRNAVGDKNWKKVAALLASTSVTGGVMALPFAGLFNKAAQSMGVDIDKEMQDLIDIDFKELTGGYGWDEENQRQLPSTISNVIRHGLPAATGVNLTGSLAVNPLMADPNKSFLENAAGYLLGPVGEIGSRVARARSSFADRDYNRAIEWMLPEMLRNPAVALRAGASSTNPETGKVEQKGFTGPTGQVFLKDPTTEELLLKALGITPERLANAYGDFSSRMAFDESKSLPRTFNYLYAEAKRRGDEEAMQQLKDEADVLGVKVSKQTQKMKKMQRENPFEYAEKQIPKPFRDEFRAKFGRPQK